MALQTEESVITLKINADAAGAAVNEMTARIKVLQKAIYDMHQEDNPAKYESIRAQLNALIIARDAEKQKILEEVAAHKQFVKEIKSGMDDVRAQTSRFQSSLNSLKNTIAAAFSIGVIIAFGKELFNLETKASGIENAFAKIGNTSGLLDKLRTASRGLISDLDLQKIAIKANNANIPIEQMGTFLAFAAQRARDTGGNVTELTEKLITGLGRGGARSLAALGISTTEVKEEFKRTGNMVEAVSHIIKREMATAGTDVDNFGDKVITLSTKLDNLKTKAASAFQKTFFKELADPEGIAKQTDIQMAAILKGHKKISDLNKDELAAARKSAQEEADKLLTIQNNAKKAFEAEGGNPFTSNIFHTLTKGSASTATREWYKQAQEAYQGARNAVDAISKNDEKNTVAGQINEDGNAKRQRELDAKKKAIAELLLQQQNLVDGLDKLNAEELARTKSKNDQELAAAAAKYDQEIKLEKNFQAKVAMNNKLSPERKSSAINASDSRIGAIDTHKEAALNAIRIKQAQDTNDAIKKYQDDQAANFSGNLDKELQKNADFYAGLMKQLASNDIDGQINIMTNKIISDAVATNNAKLAQDQKYQDEKQKLEDEYAGISDNKDISEVARIQARYDKELAAFKDQLAKKLISQQQYDALVNQAHANEEAAIALQRENDKKALKVAAVQAVEEASNTIFTIQRNNRESELEAQIKNLEAQKDVELKNANLTADQKAAINQKYAAQEATLKLKQWEADKKAAISQAIINGALGITKTFADYGFTPAAWIAAAAEAVAVTAEVVTISDQKPPSFATGGLIVDGPSHAAGGVDLVNNQNGQTIGEVEGGEAVMVLSKQTTANNNRLINELLYNSQYRNGAPVTVNTALATRPASSQYRDGGVVSAGGAAGPGQTSFGAGHTVAYDPELLAEIKLMRQAIKDQKVIFNKRVFEIESAKEAEIRRRATQ